MATQSIERETVADSPLAPNGPKTVIPRPGGYNLLPDAPATPPGRQKHRGHRRPPPNRRRVGSARSATARAAAASAREAVSTHADDGGCASARRHAACARRRGAVSSAAGRAACLATPRRRPNAVADPAGPPFHGPRAGSAADPGHRSCQVLVGGGMQIERGHQQALEHHANR